MKNTREWREYRRFNDRNVRMFIFSYLYIGYEKQNNLLKHKISQDDIHLYFGNTYFFKAYD